VSRIAETATVSLALADYASTDISGKTHIIGQGVAVIGWNPEMGVTSRFALIIDVRLPIEFSGAEFPLEIALLDEAGELALVPGPSGMQPLRVAQVVQGVADIPRLGQKVADHTGVHINVIFDLGTGVPLALHGLYTWRVQLDGDESRQWLHNFAVTGPPPGPVFG